LGHDRRSASRHAIVFGRRLVGFVSTVRGNYTCNNCLFADLHGSDSTGYVGTTINGNVVISGETDGSFIEGATIKGNLQIDSSDADGDSFAIGTGPPGAFPNKIGGNLTFTNNTGPSSIISNTIAGTLKCQNNAPAPTSSGNTAESFQGQCAA
jgi:hypothetical protein